MKKVLYFHPLEKTTLSTKKALLLIIRKMEQGESILVFIDGTTKKITKESSSYTICNY
jgi:hypothetical protein